MAVLDKAVFRLVERHFYSYHSLRGSVADYRENILFGQSGNTDQGRRGIGRHSDPTAMKAIDIVTMEKWIRVIERTVERHKDTVKAKLIQFRYFEGHGVESCCGRLHIDRATYFNWVNEIVVFAALLGVQYGLIEIDKAS